MAQLTRQYPDAAARVFVDILNEPDSFQLQWQAQGVAGLPGAGDLYLAAMDAIYPVNNGEHRWCHCIQASTRSQVEYFHKMKPSKASPGCYRLCSVSVSTDGPCCLPQSG